MQLLYAVWILNNNSESTRDSFPVQKIQGVFNQNVAIEMVSVLSSGLLKLLELKLIFLSVQ